MSDPCVPRIPGVRLTQLKRIATPGGDVLHAIKANDAGYAGFGEAYFSTVEPGAIKAWKRHRRMTLNLVVPVGAIRFVMHQGDTRDAGGARDEVVLSPESYYRLTVPPMVWMGFQGIGPSVSVLLNVADLEHDPDEIDREPPETFPFDWELTP